MEDINKIYGYLYILEYSIPRIMEIPITKDYINVNTTTVSGKYEPIELNIDAICTAYDLKESQIEYMFSLTKLSL